MIVQATLWTAFAALSAWLIYWSWRRRWLAERRAEENRALADQGRSAADLGHDLAHLVDLIETSLEDVGKLDASGQERRLKSIRESAHLLHSTFRELQGQKVEKRRTSEIVTAIANLVAETGIEVDLAIEGSLPYDAAPMHVVRITENLLLNAAREAVRAGEPAIRVVLSDTRLEVENACVDAEALDESIYEEGVSGSDSTGRGLRIARDSAAALGWHLEHAGCEGRVVFSVSRDSESIGAKPPLRKDPSLYA